MSPTYDFDLVCIGSGPAGQRAAIQAAKLGQQAAVVEKRQCVGGGVCIETGTIPSKTLREAVLVYSAIAGRADRLRFTRLDARPAAEQLFAGVDAVIAREIEVIEHQLRRNDVTLLSGDASFVDPHTLIVHSEAAWRTVTARYIVIAVGTRPAPTPGVKPDGEVILDTDHVAHLKLPQSRGGMARCLLRYRSPSRCAAVQARRCASARASSAAVHGAWTSV